MKKSMSLKIVKGLGFYKRWIKGVVVEWITLYTLTNFRQENFVIYKFSQKH